MKTPSIRAAVAIAFALFWAGKAWADPSTDDRALATALFEQGRALMTAGRTAEACPKLEESHRLDPSGGTILNLALCHEQQGMLARSWSEYHEAIAFAVRDGRGDRAQVAEAHAHALEARLSKLTVVVSEGARVDGLRIERDGRELGPASWSTAMPVDGGEHIVRATAPGKAPFSTTLVIGTESDSRTVEVPPFVALAVPPAAAILSATPAAPVLIAPAAPNTNVVRGSATRRRVGWTIGAAGLAQLGAAGYFGLQAFRKHADSNSACPYDQCTMTGVDLNNQAGRAADISTVLSITGFATVATAVYLLWTSR
jgi:serine/threonine-protein kinase